MNEMIDRASLAWRMARKRADEPKAIDISVTETGFLRMKHPSGRWVDVRAADDFDLECAVDFLRKMVSADAALGRGGE